MLGPEMAWLVTQSALRLKEMLRRVTCLVSAAVAEPGLVSKLLVQSFPLISHPWFWHKSLSWPLAVSLVSVPIIAVSTPGPRASSSGAAETGPEHQEEMLVNKHVLHDCVLVLVPCRHFQMWIPILHPHHFVCSRRAWTLHACVIPRPDPENLFKDQQDQAGGVRALILTDEIVVRIRFLICVLHGFGSFQFCLWSWWKIWCSWVPGSYAFLNGFPPLFWIAAFWGTLVFWHEK